MTLLWRVFGTNAAVLVLAAVVLVVSPLTVSFPIALLELAALGGGLVAILVLNLALLRRTFRPLGRLTAVMRGIDPLRPGERATIDEADPEVAELTAAFNDMLGRLEGERRESARRALAAQEGERRRIARELHDEVGQALTAVILQLDRADQSADRLGRGSRDGAREPRGGARDRSPPAAGGARRSRVAQRAGGADERHDAPDGAAGRAPDLAGAAASWTPRRSSWSTGSRRRR